MRNSGLPRVQPAAPLALGVAPSTPAGPPSLQPPVFDPSAPCRTAVALGDKQRWNKLMAPMLEPSPLGPRPRVSPSESDMDKVLVSNVHDPDLLAWLNQACAHVAASRSGIHEHPAASSSTGNRYGTTSITRLLHLLAPACRESLGVELVNLVTGDLFPKLYLTVLTHQLIQALGQEDARVAEIARIAASNYIQLELRIAAPNSPEFFRPSALRCDAHELKHFEAFGTHLHLLPKVRAATPKIFEKKLEKISDVVTAINSHLARISEMVFDIELYFQSLTPLRPAPNDAPTEGRKYRSFERLLVGPDKSWNKAEAQKLATWMGCRPDTKGTVVVKQKTVNRSVRGYDDTLLVYRKVLETQGVIQASPRSPSSPKPGSKRSSTQAGLPERSTPSASTEDAQDCWVQAMIKRLNPEINNE
jgi:hypothetical protein